MPRSSPPPPLLRKDYMHHFVSVPYQPTHLQSVMLCNSSYAFARCLGTLLGELDPFQRHTHQEQHAQR